MSFPPCRSHQDGTENACYCSVRPCPVFSLVTTVLSCPVLSLVTTVISCPVFSLVATVLSSPVFSLVTTVLAFPLIFTSQCCLHNMSLLPCVTSRVLSCSVLFTSIITPESLHVPISHSTTFHPSVFLTFTYRCFPLIAGNILSTPTPNPTLTPIPVKVSDSDLLELRIIIVDSTTGEMCVRMSLDAYCNDCIMSGITIFGI